MIEWDEFKLDNPFNLTMTQFIRCRKYFPGYAKLERKLKRNTHKYIPGRTHVWICSCGVHGRGNGNKTKCTKSIKTHMKRYHGGEYMDYKIIKIVGD